MSDTYASIETMNELTGSPGITDHWTGKLAKGVFFVVAVPIVIIGALSMLGFSGPSLPEWLLLGMSPGQMLSAPLTIFTALAAGSIVSAPFWLIAYLVQQANKDKLQRINSEQTG